MINFNFAPMPLLNEKIIFWRVNNKLMKGESIFAVSGGGLLISEVLEVSFFAVSFSVKIKTWSSFHLLPFIIHKQTKL